MTPSFPARLDPKFRPMAAEFRCLSAADASEPSSSPAREVFHVALERENGLISRESIALEQESAEERARFAERCVKFLLWSRGAWKLHLAGSPDVVRLIEREYSPGGARAFDLEMMEKVYDRQFEIRSCGEGELPPAHEKAAELGGNLEGCRIGFDLGASDYKIAAVRDGEVVFSDEFPWNPKDEPDPAYHYEHLNAGLRKAAESLPRVDAIGGSSAGVIVNNRFMVASLLRSIAPEKLDDARNLFLRLREEWGVPLEVANDGDVTALAGAMSLDVHGLLGIAMGSSEAAGYINPAGKMTGWLNELAFAPVDLNPDAPADEWSGDHGVGALYFSQQAVNKILPAAGIEVSGSLGLPERLKLVQERMVGGDPDVEPIYETIGVYLGHSIPLYRRFYEFGHVLVLGRVTTGIGGTMVLKKAREVLKHDYPGLSEQIELHLPDEKSRRVGQAVAAASLPSLNGNTQS